MNIYGLIIDVLTALASSIEQIQMLTDENHIQNVINDEVNHTNKRRRRKRSDDDDDNRPHKRKYTKYDRARAYNCVMDDYFNPQPIFDDYQFERFFRITPSLAEYILRRLANNDEFWTLRYDCTKRMSNAPEVKLLAALKMVCYGESFSAWQDYFQMGESTARLCLMNLMRGLLNDVEITAKFIRKMSPADARRVEEMHFRESGLRGMLGFLDVMLVPWGQCPSAEHGQYKGRSKQPSIALEAACDRNLWIWHYYFGEPGGLNDINVWDRSPLKKAILSGEISELDFPFTINDVTFIHQLYWLVDGIYPLTARFVKAISNPITLVDREFTGWQESYRKSIERAFGVMEKKFHYLFHPVQTYTVGDIGDVVGGCIILHNMMVDHRMKRDQEEDGNFYELVPSNVPHYDRPTDAEIAIAEEDEQFEASTNNGGESEYRRQKADAEVLGHQLRIVQYYWGQLYNEQAHLRLQDAIKTELYRNNHGEDADINAMGNHNPLNDYPL